MELDYYFFKSKRTQVEFAKKSKIAPHTISNFVNKHRSPSLIDAIKIHLESGGQVGVMELLCPKELEEVNNLYGVIKTVSL
jgi:hypothetical protein